MSTSLLQPPNTGEDTFLSDKIYRRLTLGQPGPSRRPVPPISMAASEPFFIPFGNEGAFVFDKKPDLWIIPLLDRISQLGSLLVNWDSYGARPIDPKTATYTVELLLEILSESDPFPSVVPTNHGGIQLEWHEGGIDLEIDIRSPSSVDISIEDGEHDEDLENVRIETIQEKLNILRSRLQSTDENV